MSVYNRGTVIEVPNENYVFNVLGEVLNKDLSKTDIIVVQKENVLSHQLSKMLYVSEKFLTDSGVIKSITPVKRKEGSCAYFNGIGGEFIELSHVRGIRHQYILRTEDVSFIINCYNSDENAVRLDISGKLWVNLRKNNISDQEIAYSELCEYRYISDFVSKFIVSRNWFEDPVKDNGVII